MTVSSDLESGAVARHHIANLLFTYIDIADRKDVDAVCELLAQTYVQFPFGASNTPSQTRELFTKLWMNPTPHRHDVTNLRVLPGGPDGRMWCAHAHYTRWVLESTPVLHTLGEYSLVVDSADWMLTELTVTRTWAQG